MKNCVLKTRVTEQEKLKFADQAACLMITESELLRQKLGEHSKSELTETLHLLKKISNNVNQIAKALNIANLTGRIEPRRYEIAFTNTYNLQKLFHKVLDEFSKIKKGKIS